MMQCRFHKLHGLGNDFMLLDTSEASNKLLVDNLSVDQIRQWANRHTGIGFDQLLVLDKRETQWQLAFYNADGSTAQQCGNGLRATALWLNKQGYYDAEADVSIAVMTSGGIIRLGVVEPVMAGSGRFYADLPAPVLIDKITDYQQPQRFTQASAITVGNPHLVIDCDDPKVMRTRYGSQLVSDHGLFSGLPSDAFSQGCNISFSRRVAETPASRTVDLCVWERGAGPTNACGSAACAVAASMLSGKPGIRVDVRQPGGSLMLEYLNTTTLRMTGAAAYVYAGEITITP